jgi:hypothetical protein
VNGRPRNVAVPRGQGGGHTSVRIGPRLEFVLPERQTSSTPGMPPEPFEVSPAMATAGTVVRFGLWNAAFSTAGTPAGVGAPQGTLRNGDADADHFIGSDLRRFYVRLVDPRMVRRPPAAPGALPRTVVVQLETRNDDGSACDVRSGDAAEITLIEDAGSAGTFVSRPLLLVNREPDLFVPTNPGLPRAPGAAAPANRVYGERDHRVRMGNMYGTVRARHAPHGRRAIVADATVFAPSERTQLEVEVFTFSRSGGGFTMVDRAPMGAGRGAAGYGSSLRSFSLEDERENVRQVFSQVGIDALVRDPLHEVTLPAPLPVTRPAAAATQGTTAREATPATLTTVTDVDEARFEALQINFPPADPWVVRLMVIDTLAASLTPAGTNTIGLSPSLQPGMGTTAQLAAVIESQRQPFTGAHELIHLLGYMGHAPTTEIFHVMHPNLTPETGLTARVRLDAYLAATLHTHNGPAPGGTGVLRAPPADAGAAYRASVYPREAASLPRT